MYFLLCFLLIISVLSCKTCYLLKNFIPKGLQLHYYEQFLISTLFSKKSYLKCHNIKSYVPPPYLALVKVQSIFHFLYHLLHILKHLFFLSKWIKIIIMDLFVTDVSQLLK